MATRLTLTPIKDARVVQAWTAVEKSGFIALGWTRRNKRCVPIYGDKKWAKAGYRVVPVTIIVHE